MADILALLPIMAVMSINNDQGFVANHQSLIHSPSPALSVLE